MHVDDNEVIGFLMKTEIIPLCLRTMEMGSDLSKNEIWESLVPHIEDGVTTRPVYNAFTSNGAMGIGHGAIGDGVYFQVHYTEDNLLDYIDPKNDTLMVRLANGRLLAQCRIMLGTDKRATITTNSSEFRRRANIREFQDHFKTPPSSHRALPLDAPSKILQSLCQYNLALSTPNYALSRDNLWFAFGPSYHMLSKTLNLCRCLCKVHYSQSDGSSSDP